LKIRTEFTFAAAHRLLGYEGECGRLHGHNWRVVVDVDGDIDERGFIVDFRDVKKIKEVFDHRVILHPEDPLVRILDDVVTLQYGNPTCENIAWYVADLLKSRLPDHYISVWVWETDDSYAEVIK